MTPQQIEAMKLALEALELINIEFVCGNGSHHKKEDRHEWDEDCPITNRWRKAITAIKEALAQPEQPSVPWSAALESVWGEPEQEPVVHDPLPRACNLAGVDYQTFLKIKAYMPVAPPQPERHELQAKGEHPAPCARHCEANAFQIVIKNLKAQLAQPKREPVIDKSAAIRIATSLGWTPQRTWVGLTEQDLDYLCNLAYTGDEEFALAVQAKLMEKNA